MEFVNNCKYSYSNKTFVIDGIGEGSSIFVKFLSLFCVRVKNTILYLYLEEVVYMVQVADQQRANNGRGKYPEF